ncbi:hypothetical protein EYF80_052942 [Liparis tanakae]|uniref:Uncharacterized protein n=1 Tax=Liparis tanakae TaxID=230148 RepID=A0A4Z2F999_9TELE|nr:hypothetical protein EYF80_052942 [Liparis tanakae]
MPPFTFSLIRHKETDVSRLETTCWGTGGGNAERPQRAGRGPAEASVLLEEQTARPIEGSAMKMFGSERGFMRKCAKGKAELVDSV